MARHRVLLKIKFVLAALEWGCQLSAVIVIITHGPSSFCCGRYSASLKFCIHLQTVTHATPRELGPVRLVSSFRKPLFGFHFGAVCLPLALSAFLAMFFFSSTLSLFAVIPSFEIRLQLNSLKLTSRRNSFRSMCIHYVLIGAFECMRGRRNRQKLAVHLQWEGCKAMRNCCEPVAGSGMGRGDVRHLSPANALERFLFDQLSRKD